MAIAREKSNFIEKLIGVRRVTKVVKGGRTLRFAALTVVGDGDGSIGIGTGKARDVASAVAAAMAKAHASMVKVNIVNNTIHHEVSSKYCASTIYIQPASPGTGIIAGGPARAVFEAVGIRDILAKNIGSTNPHNIVNATLQSLLKVRSPIEIAAKRGRPTEEIQARHKQSYAIR